MRPSSQLRTTTRRKRHSFSPPNSGVMRGSGGTRQQKPPTHTVAEALVDNQHQKISGYRDLSQGEIDLMNEVKGLEAKWNGLVDRLRANSNLDQRQVSIAVTEGENAFMRAVRAIAQPTRQVA
jgi:hypothetical protein